MLLWIIGIIMVALVLFRVIVPIKRVKCEDNTSVIIGDFEINHTKCDENLCSVERKQIFEKLESIKMEFSDELNIIKGDIKLQNSSSEIKLDGINSMLNRFNENTNELVATLREETKIPLVHEGYKKRHLTDLSTKPKYIS